jgi:hypothetical protein
VTTVRDPGHPVSNTTITMSDWGERVAVAPPPSPVPIADVAALVHQLSLLEIPGASGYLTYTGPRGYPGPIGRPWGQACKPIVFGFNSSVPSWIYEQAVQVINEARKQGVDVAAENREGRGNPASLYYRDGESPKTVAVVGVFVKSGVPPVMTDGKHLHINLLWDAKLDSDHHNEDLTAVEGDLYTKVLTGHAELVRRSIRELIAMTQGITSTRLSVSGISNVGVTDRFTSEDIAAMLRMSGCG